MKLSDFSQNQLTVEGAEVPIYVEVDELLPSPSHVPLELEVQYQQADGRPTSKTLTRMARCERTMLKEIATAQGMHAFKLVWTVGLERDDALREKLVKINFKLPNVTVKEMHPKTIGVVGIEITKQDSLKRIMWHEFSTPRGFFDPSALHCYLSTLTVEQRQVLVRSALGKPAGRLVIFINLYSPSVLTRRMYADWSDKSGVGVVANATFSVFFCRDDTKLGAASLRESAPSTSPVTLVCHTEYFCLCLVNKRTQDFLNPPAGNPKACGVYSGQRPNDWLKKRNPAPPKFLIAALQPSSEVSKGVIWNAIYEAGTGHNIMPGNSVHGMINTKGCWMLFRNFNWPHVRVPGGTTLVSDELYRVYRKVYRSGDEKKTTAVLVGLRKAGYDEEYPPEGRSTSFDKFSRYDRNWAYEWFFHEVVGVKYFSDSDYWGNKESVNDYLVGGHDFLNSFPVDKARQPPPYNLPEEGNLAYHDFDKRDKNVKIDASLFRTNALGIRTASDFVKGMHAKLTTDQLENCCWADVYFYKDGGVDAEKLTPDSVKDA